MPRDVDAIEADLRHLGCSDGNCAVMRPRGMHTNGGCRCLAFLDAASRALVTKILALHQERGAGVDVLRDALSWISTADGVSMAAARRSQRVAAGALHKGEPPSKTLACEKCGAELGAHHHRNCEWFNPRRPTAVVTP